MSDEQLASLSSAAGLSVDWLDANGRPQRVSVESQRALVESLGYAAQSPQQIAASLAHLEHEHHSRELPPLLTHELHRPLSLASEFASDTHYQLELEDGRRIDGRLDGNACLHAIEHCGYHRLHIADRELTVAVAPPACLSVEELTDGQRRHIWGLTAQLYSLRRPGDGGLGDMQALADLARSAAQHGADALAISPVHAMFSAWPGQYSPYSPSSRLLFNSLHAAPDVLLGEAAVNDALQICGLQGSLKQLESLDLVDWPGVTDSRQRLLRQLYRSFRDQHNALTPDFDKFLLKGGDALLLHCRFEALQGFMVRHGMPGDWRTWPEHYRDPNHANVDLFASDHALEVGYHAFCQWLIARGLDRAQAAALGSGMKIGLIADLAVGADGAGSQAWARQDELLQSLTVGAPPDILNRQGQSWGISAFSPDGLRRHGYRAFIEMLQANLAHVGGVRIDHVMGLKRLWVIPQGAPAQAGAYLNYPLQDLLRLVALESWRNRALVIGEDLGTVPDGLREELAQRRLLGMRVLLFEQRDGGFIPAPFWPDDALATTTTHDLPTLHGWMQGRDIEWREQAGHSTREHSVDDHNHRQWEKHCLQKALQDCALLPIRDNSITEQLDASVSFLGSTPAPLVLLPLEDAMGEFEQPNLPGPGDTHPNWRRRWPINAKDMLERPEPSQRLQRLDQARRARDHLAPLVRTHHE
jgi:4-alpha-glucanotransferase